MPNNEDRPFWERSWVGLLTLLALAMISVAFFDLTRTLPIDYELTNEDYYGLFVNLGVIAIVIERLIEVFNSVWRRKGRIERSLKVEQAGDDGKNSAKLELAAYRS